MANNPTPLDLISQSQDQKEVTANALFDPASPAMTFGRRASGCIGLTWAYYGGYFVVNGAPIAVAAGTVALTASATNYIRVNSSGTVVVTTSAPSGWPGPFAAGDLALYLVTTNASAPSSWTDLRFALSSGVNPALIPSSGSSQSQEFTASGTFTPGANVSGVRITMIGAGGGGSATIAAATGGGGGGSGELVQNMPVAVTPSVGITVTIGAAGTGAASGLGSATAGGNGGNTSFGSTYVAKGGQGGLTTGASGAGGGINGSASKGTGVPGVAGSIGTAEAPTYFGGSSGGGGGSSISAAGGAGSGAGGYVGSAGGAVNASQAGGGGGASTIWGLGGAGGAGGGAGSNAAAGSYGSGGGGAGGKATTTAAGGNGAPGYVLVQWT